MSEQNGAIDEVDLCTLALLKELADLDALEGKSGAAQRTLASSALELVERLEALGGGSLGGDKLAAIRAQLRVLIKRR